MSLPTPRPIALIGLPGAGKTTIGVLLADHLALPFRDSDTEIERATGDAIPHLFATHGEPYFRQLERKAINRLLDGTPLILATGGGAMTDAATRQILLTRATTLWLDVPPEILAVRLEGQSDRPLLAGNLEPRLKKLQAERQTFYRAATHRIDAARSPAAVVTAIIRALGATIHSRSS